MAAVRRAQRFQHHYDGNDRVTWIETRDSEYDLHFSYDDSDNRTAMSSPSVSTAFTYDDANRLTLRTDVVGGQSFSVGYAHDTRDNLTKTTYPSGRKVIQQFDGANRIEVVREEDGPTYARGAGASDPMTYYPNGVLASYTAGNGIAYAASLTVDQRQRLKDIDTGPVRVSYSYDKVGNVDAIDDRSDRNRDSAFQYDALDRLEGVTGFGATTYTDDALGNRRTRPGVTYVYDEATQRLTHDGTGLHGHDDNGNTTSVGSALYTYSPFNMMASATAGGATTPYGHDADQQRRRRSGPGGTEYFVPGPGFVPLAEYRDVDGTLTWARDYIYAGTRLIASVAPTVSVPTYTFTDDPLVAGQTLVKAVHLTELRAAINTARALWSLPAIDPWPTDDVVTQHVTVVKKAHLDEMRDALHAAYVAAGATPPVYTDPTVTVNETPIKAVHFTELRAAVRAVPPPATGGTVEALSAMILQAALTYE